MGYFDYSQVDFFYLRVSFLDDNKYFCQIIVGLK